MPTADPWQSELLSQMVTKRENIILNCSSQCGKTETASLGVYLSACLGMYVIIITPSDRQSVEFHDRVRNHHNRLRLIDDIEDPNKHTLLLKGGGKVVALPNSPDKIRGISAVDLLVADEASRVSDALYDSATRFLTVRNGRTVMLSTPFGQRGFFWKEWTGRGEKGWRRHQHPWTDCPRITPEFIERKRLARGDDFVKQEYETQFLSTAFGYFNVEKFESLITDEPVEEVAW